MIVLLVEQLLKHGIIEFAHVVQWLFSPQMFSLMDRLVEGTIFATERNECRSNLDVEHLLLVGP